MTEQQTIVSNDALGIGKALEAERKVFPQEQAPIAEPEVAEPIAEELIEAPVETAAEIVAEAPQEKPVEQPTEELTIELDDDFITPIVEAPVVESFVKKNEAKLKALGIEAANDDEFFEKVKAIKEGSKPSFADPIIEFANELATQGVKYADYLAFQQTDFTKIADETLLRQQLSEYFDGDQDQIENALDEMTPTQKLIQAKQYRQSLISTQTSEKAFAESLVTKGREQYQQGIREAFNSIDAISGVKVQPQHKQILQNKLNGKSFDAIYLQTDGRLDPRKVAEAAMKIEYFNNVAKVASQKAKSEAKKEVFESMSNVQPLDKPTSLAVEEKAISKADQWIEQFQKSQRRN
jgi:hypothetical protein